MIVVVVVLKLQPQTRKTNREGHITTVWLTYDASDQITATDVISGIERSY